MGYYVVHDKAINELIEKTFNDHHKDKKTLYKFIKENYKTEEFYESSRGVVAIKFKENPDPKVWKKSDIGRDAYTLKRVSKLAKAMAAEFDKLNKKIELKHIVQALNYGEGTSGCYMGTNMISFNPGIQLGNDGKYYLSTPEWVDGKWAYDKESIEEITSGKYKECTTKTVHEMPEESSTDNVQAP